MDLNSCTLVGRLVKSPELKYTANQKALATFTIAVNEYYKGYNENNTYVSFIDIVSWGKTSEFIAQYGSKGMRIGVRGRIRQETWTNNDGQKRSKVKIVADAVQLLDKKRDDNPQNMNEQEKIDNINSGGNDDGLDIPDLDAEDSDDGDSVPF